MDSLYIIIPAYNEEANIQSVVAIIDDGSADHTFTVLQEMAQTRPLLLPITKPNAGHGATVLYGYQYALEHNADYIFQTDSDGQTLSEEFGQFWALREQYSLVTGHRRKRQDGVIRMFVTMALKAVIRLCFHVTIQDANTPYRLMQADKLRENIK